MRRKETIPANGDDRIILAAPDDRDLLAASTAIESLNISLEVVMNMDDLKRVSSSSERALGIIVTQNFLGENILEGLKKIKSMFPETPIIPAASNTDAVFEKTMRQTGIFYYLLSPYDREEFLCVIRALYSYKTKKKGASLTNVPD